MAKRPNILVVLSDQQRPDSCGVFGQRLDVTPNLDTLAAGGVAFDNSFTVQPLCGPSRAALQTGLMPTTTGCWRNGRSLPQGQTTMATALGSAGYWTGYLGKWHLASDGGYLPKPGTGVTRFGNRPVPPERRGGYDDLWLAADSLEATSLPYRGHVFDGDGNKVELTGFRVDGLTDLVIDALRGRADEERPFFMFVSFLEPHHQNNRFRTIGPKGWAKRFGDYDVPADLKGTLGDWRWNYAEYLACCASIDANLGRITDALERMGKLDNTLIVYSSDHGSHFRTRNLEYKRSPHDASIRVPLVVRGPGFRGGQISESQVGRALRTERHTYAVTGKGLGRLARYRDPAADVYEEYLLYDNVEDPAQRHNLAGTAETAELRRTLATQLEDEIERLEGTRPRVLVGSS